MLGPKIDARLNMLERKLVDLTHRLERLETPPKLLELPVVVLQMPEKVLQADTDAVQSVENTEVSQEKVIPKRRGRPPKATNG